MSIAKILTSFLTIFSVILELFLSILGGGGETPVEPPSTTEPPTSVTQPSKPDTDYGKGKFIFTTYGWGHGVGMSQYGIYELGNLGYDCRYILKAYYSGISYTTYKESLGK